MLGGCLPRLMQYLWFSLSPGYSAEVLKGLSKAFNDYTQKNEEAWKEG